jgi:16S rRNA processing protein RimM
MRDFLQYVVQHLVDRPDLVALEQEEQENKVTFRLKVAQGEVGKVIGKNGRTAQAIRVLLAAVAAREGKRAVLEIGDIVVTPLTDNPGRFRKLRKAFLGAVPETAREVQITMTHVERRGIRLHLGGVEDRTAAGNLSGLFLFVDQHHRIPLPKGRYFAHQIVGMTVIDQEGQHCGVVREVAKLPAQDVYVIEDRGRSFMLPAVREFILNIDLETRTLRVRLIEGMREVP